MIAPISPSPSIHSVLKNIYDWSLSNFGELRGYSNMPDDGRIDNETATTLRHAYAACISYVDAQIGRLLQALDELGLRDNTIVMLWGDHGWKLGEHDSWSKHTCFEIDTRVPLIVRDPIHGQAGGVVEGQVEFIDLFPTLCDTCTLPTPEHLSGQSLKPLLAEPTGSGKAMVMSQFPTNVGGVPRKGYSLRTERFRFTEWVHGETGESCGVELYDHQADPHENINVAGKPFYVDHLQKLRQQLDTLRHQQEMSFVS